MGVILALLIPIFVTHRAARYLADAVDGELAPSLIASLLFLKTAIAMEVLLPISLYLSVVYALGRLQEDSELLALSSAGVSSARVTRPVLEIAVTVAVVVAGLSLFVRPWAYDLVYRLKAIARSGFDLALLEGGRFYVDEEGGYVVFADRCDAGRTRAEGVFFRREKGESVRVLCARQVSQEVDRATGRRTVVALDGREYRFDRREQGTLVLEFERLEVPLRREELALEYRQKAVPTRDLAASRAPADVAEFQWRIVVPVSTVLLVLLAVPIGRAAFLRGRYARFIAAALVYAGYYNLSGMARTFVEQEVVGPVPGIWWVEGLLASLLLARLAFRARA